MVEPSETTILSPSMLSRLSPRLYFAVAVACLGLLQFGYHISELNPASEIITCRVSRDDWLYYGYGESPLGQRGIPWCIPMTVEQFGMATSIFSIGGLLGSFVAGRIADNYGRRRTALGHSVLFILGLLITALSLNFLMLVFGRFISGIAAGLALVVTPLLISELSPKNARGFFGSMNQLLINLGIAIVCALGLVTRNDLMWRFPLLGGALIGAANFLVLLICDELPVWIARQGDHELAQKVLFKLRRGDFSELVREVVLWGIADANLESLVPLEKYLQSPEYRKSLIVTTGILVLQQFTGINSIVMYGTNTLSVPFPHSAVLINWGLSMLNLVMTFVSANVIDRLGRKPLLKTSALFLALGSVTVGYGIMGNHYNTIIDGLIIYITAFAIGLGPIPFLIVSEVTQSRAQALAQSWGVTMNWLATFVVGYLFPQIGGIIGGWVYVVFGFFCIITYFFTLNYIPETLGKSTYAEVWGIHPVQD